MTTTIHLTADDLDWIKQVQAVAKYNPSQPRDDRGRWTDGAAGSFAVDTSSMPSGTSESHKEFLATKTKTVQSAIEKATGHTVDATIVWMSPRDMPGHAAGNIAGYYRHDQPGKVTMADAGGSMFFMTHEYAHLLDREYFGKGTYGSGNGRESSELGGVMGAIQDSPQFRDWKYNTTQPEYWASNHETFARAFAQYVTMKSGEPTLFVGLEDQQEKGNQWPDAYFAPIAAEFDKLFS